MDPQMLASTPAGVPPPGIQPNFSNPHGNGAALISVASVLLVLMLVFVSARVYTKIKIIRKWSPDDYTCLLATIGAIFYYVMVLLDVTIGKYGIHSWDLHLSDLMKTSALIIGFLSNWPFFIVIMFAKVTFFLLYLQIFYPMTWLRYTSYAGATFTILFYIGATIFNLVCTAPAPGESWQQVTQRYSFNYTVSATVGLACVGLVLDVIILLLPIAGVLKLQISGRRKIGVISVFLTGTIAVIASALSIYYKRRLEQNYTTDATYDSLPVLTTAVVELCVGIIASSMPSMSSFLRHMPDWKHIKSVFSSRSRYASKYGSYEDSSKGSGSDPKKAAYKDLDKWRRHGSHMPGYEMGSGEAFITAVPKEKQGTVVENRIHLQHDLEQQSQERSFTG